ncbi:DUF992 domain-containing protein [Aureimonas mangrovi]|uniref:DUF992 domain-containing protein n=1 Tax=Aureimonas mangrovi TaxID=2758041 RepID=UPI00163D98FD|nr:DUF992 domain-containing protein [Aureimonas mangrovi]
MKRVFATALVTAMIGANVAQAADMPVYEPVEAVPLVQERDGVRIGYMTCDIGGGVGYVLGSAKTLDCVFQSTVGAQTTEVYTGVMRKMGVDLGFTTRGQLVWAVLAPTAGYHLGSLGGVYQGATVEATLGAGAGANILVGGTAGSIQLQTVSLSGQIGLNAAATGTSVTLTPAV